MNSCADIAPDRVETNFAIIVLGMHRSGTSSIAGALVTLGAKAPNTPLPAASDNERGFFESLQIMQLNDEILRSAGTTWDDWRAFNPAWFSSPVAKSFEERAIAALKGEFGSAPLAAIKDPRLCRLMPFWSNAINEAGYSPRIVIPIRSPLEVARSLWLRNGIPLSKGLLMWLRHVLDAEASSRAHPTAFVEWSEFLADWRFSLARIGERLGLDWPRLSDQSAAEIDRFISPTLRHNSVSIDDLKAHRYVHDWVLKVYEALLTLAADPSSEAARHQLDEVKSEFDEACKFFGGILLDFEESALRERQEADSARGERDQARQERDHQIEETARRASELAALIHQRDQLGAEALALRHEVERLAAERDELRRQHEAIAHAQAEAQAQADEQTQAQAVEQAQAQAEPEEIADPAQS